MFAWKNIEIRISRQGGFTYNLWIEFCQLNFFKNLQTFLEVKIEINQDNLTPCQAHWVLQTLLLGVAKDEHFSYFHNNKKTLAK